MYSEKCTICLKILILIFANALTSFGQKILPTHVEHHYLTKCKGDTLTILSPYFYIPQKTKKVVHNDCTYDDTVNEPNWDDFNVQGPGLLPYNRINKQCGIGSLGYCGQVENLRFVIRESATLVVNASWRSEVEYEGNPCQNYYGEGWIQPYAYIFHISVPKTNAPTLSADKDIVQIGTEMFSFSVQGCDRLLPNVEVFIATCNNPKPDNNKREVRGAISIHAFESPRQGTTGIYYVRCTDNTCYSDWSNAKHTEVVPTINPCDDPILDYINTIKQSPLRIDNHYYKVETVVCNKTENLNCTRDIVFNTLLEERTYNTPIASDLPGVPMWGSGLLFKDNIGKVDKNNCANFNLASPTAILINFAAFAYGIKERNLDPYIFLREATLSNPIANPIGQYVDRRYYSVTNYTKPGHILFPGRVIRTVVDDCDTIKIVTNGIGNSMFGPTDLGAGFASLNKNQGIKIFRNADQRLIDAFNKLPR